MKILKGLTVLFFIGMVFMFKSGYSQELGLRFGNALGNKGSVAVDGVFALGKFSRVHADVSFGSGVGLEALWDFAFRPISDSPLYYYIGVLYMCWPVIIFGRSVRIRSGRRSWSRVSFSKCSGCSWFGLATYVCACSKHRLLQWLRFKCEVRV